MEVITTTIQDMKKQKMAIALQLMQSQETKDKLSHTEIGLFTGFASRLAQLEARCVVVTVAMCGVVLRGIKLIPIVYRINLRDDWMP